MKKIVIAAALLMMTAALAHGQSKKFNTSVDYGWIYQRLAPKYRLQIPTACGAPAGLFSTDFKQSAIYFDSCAKKIYTYSPTDSAWSIVALLSDVSDSITSAIKSNNDSINAADALSGSVYNKLTFASLSEFTNNGVVAYTSAGKISLSPVVTGTSTASLALSAPITSNEYFRFRTVYKVNTTQSGSSYGLAFGVKSTNSFYPADMYAWLDLSSGSGYLRITIQRPSAVYVATSTTQLTYSLNDEIETTVERTGFTITATARNITTNSARVTTTYAFTGDAAVSANAIGNTGQYALFAIGGNYLIESINISSKELAHPKVLLIGDSRTVGYGDGYSYRWADILRKSYNSVTVSAGGGDRTTEIIAKMSELLACKPQIALIEIGTNETFDAGFQTRYQSIVTQLTAAGVKVYHLAFGDAFSASKFAWLKSVYGSDVIDNSYYYTQAAGSFISDGVHLSVFGNQQVANAVLETGYLKGATMYTEGASASAVPGANKQVIFNDGGVLAGGSSLEYNKTGGALAAGLFRANNYIPFTYGAGTEVLYYPPFQLGQIYAYDRDNSVFKDLQLGTGGNQLYLKADGNTGIKDASPLYPLSVQGNTDASAVGPMVVHSTGGSNIGTALTLDATDNTGGHKFSFLSTGSGAGYGAGSFAIFDGTAIAYRMLLDPTGKLKIGNGLPAEMLDVTGNVKASGTMKTGGYTVATLPAPVLGTFTFVTDALAPTYMAPVVGGGGVIQPVFGNGTAWVAH